MSMLMINNINDLFIFKLKLRCNTDVNLEFPDNIQVFLTMNYFLFNKIEYGD